MNHIRLVACLFSLCAASTVLGQGLPRAAPESVGLSPERLERIGVTSQALVDDGKIAGALGLIARKGKIAYFETWGMQNLEKNQAMRPDTIFRIRSQTKAIVSTAIMMLFEEGKLRVTDPVSRFLPELKDLEVSDGEGGTVAAEREITIQDLLRHTTGLNQIRDQKTLAEMITTLSKRPLRDQPGTRWYYNDINAEVLGRVVEVVSGMALDRFLRERILEPLKMFETSFTVPKDRLDRFAELYFDYQDKLIPAPPALSSRYHETTYFSGGSGLVSTATDYLRFCQMFLDQGELEGVRLLGRKTVELMTMDHLGEIELDWPRKGYGFGLGFAVMRDIPRQGTLSSPGLYDWWGGNGTHFWVDPKEDMIGIYMVQIRARDARGPRQQQFGHDFRALCYQAIVD